MLILHRKKRLICPFILPKHYLIITSSGSHTDTREVIKATITNGVDNQSIIKNLGKHISERRCLCDKIPVFDKSFMSPFSDNADEFYHFKLHDTQYMNKEGLVHFCIRAKASRRYFF